ncbi:hypothetical protein BRADI_2g06960v3 [Brachypodium distachyon]|uniref:Uncharacterized protein n=1 Tax=Brachypodium distachyon TaxID=15368 RepID=I1HD98_BRADI|nr:hypothetical protein BRADI_2g06960v3 [Brachypodium distachyon]
MGKKVVSMLVAVVLAGLVLGCQEADGARPAAAGGGFISYAALTNGNSANSTAAFVRPSAEAHPHTRGCSKINRCREMAILCAPFACGSRLTWDKRHVCTICICYNMTPVFFNGNLPTSITNIQPQALASSPLGDSGAPATTAAGSSSLPSLSLEVVADEYCNRRSAVTDEGNSHRSNFNYSA